MRILFLWPTRLRQDLGGPKIVLELAEALRNLGWQPTLFDPWTLPDGADASRPWAERCRFFLQSHAAEFDVIDYDHGHLPFARSEFFARTLMVARSGLLSHHFVHIPIPDIYPWRDKLRRLVKGKGPQERYAENCQIAHTGCVEADVVNVSNDDDKEVLVKSGLPESKIGVFPFGLNSHRRESFAGCNPDVPAEFNIAFVGSFDGRKGAVEFPRIVARVVDQVPAARFHLLGTVGRFQTAEEVKNYFPPRLRPHLSVVPTYLPDELPGLLAKCSLGIFPSHIEGFGFGVLEMLAASLPVIAYRAPGPPMMLPSEYLVLRGDADSLAHRVVYLLQNPERLLQARRWAQNRILDFTWENIAENTAEFYQARWQKLQIH